MARHSRLSALAVLMVLLAPGALTSVTAQAGEDATAPEGAGLFLREPVVVNAAAVAQTEDGLVGSVATISISAATNGSGHIFMDTVPLTQVDMQGSARLAVQVAGVVTGLDVSTFDVFFVVRSGSQIIGGPSAGAIMTVGAVAALKGWRVDPGVMMTGTINPDGSIGPVGGVPEKAAAAAQQGARLFLYPEGQEAARRGRVTVDMAAYCERELGIECRAVPDVESAIPLVTGHAFEQPELTGNVTDAEYRRLMQPFAARLFENASASLEDADAALSSATGIPTVVREELEKSRTRANDAITTAQTALDDERYYTTASKAFQASIEARFISSVVGYHEAEDGGAFVERVLVDTGDRVHEAATSARAAGGVDAAKLQALGAAQVRASEAESRLADAERLVGNASNVLGLVDAFYQAAWAFERAQTATWWLEIGDRFKGASATLDRSHLARVARESISSAEESVTYAEVIMQEAGVLTQDVPVARDKLARARADFQEGYLVAATFQAVEAEVQANLALELLGYEGGIPDGKVEKARAGAERAILLSRERGLEPLLAVPYYEFAGSFTGDPVQQLLFYNLARTLARLTQFLRDPAPEPAPSRFVGESGLTRAPFVPLNHVGAFFAMGLALGAVLSVIVLVPSRELEGRKGDREPPRGREPDWSTAAVITAGPFDGGDSWRDR